MSEIINPIVLRIDEAMEASPEYPRSHIGPSQAGEPCERRLWLSFRWAVKKCFSGRMLRLFRRGQNEEAEAVKYLRMIGVDVRETGENQRRVYFGGHVAGSIDGIIESGIPESPNTRHILEVKTHNLKSFNDLERKGVRESKPEHYSQMQCYMKGVDIKRALYYAVCKDDDRLYTERVEYDAVEATRSLEKLRRVSLVETIPAPISNDPSWYQCKMCEACDFCHVTKITKEVNCRTCAHATPMQSGKWHCVRWASEIPTDAQRDGCDSHVLHPDLVPWKLDHERSTEIAAYYDGVGLNGEGGIRSIELCNLGNTSKTH